MSAAKPLRLEFSPSVGFAIAILSIHAAAAACFLTTMTGWPGMALAVLILALGAASAWDRALLRGSRSPLAVEIDASGNAAVALASGERVAAESVRGIGVARLWVALKGGSSMRRGILVAAGMLGREELRVLRLWALWGRIPAVALRQLPA